MGIRLCDMGYTAIGMTLSPNRHNQHCANAHEAAQLPRALARQYQA